MVFRNIAVALTGDGRSLGQTLRQGAAQVDAFGNTVERSNGKSERSFLKTAAATAAVVISLHAAQAGFDATVGAAAGFESRLRNVNSITHTTDAGLRAIGASTLALSRELPQSANTLAEGLYDIASSGFQGAEGLQVLEASGEAASAGLTNTANSAKAITAVLNAYGLSAASAGAVSDSLFQTVNLGVVSFEELTGVIGDVVGTAAAASVDINQVGAAVATMTLSGISAAEAGTSLNRVLQSILQPSEALAAQMGALGYASGEQALQADGLRGVMDRLRVATGGNVTTLLQLFPEIRAARGALALMSDEGRNYAKVSAGIDDANVRQGATQRALAEQMKAVSAQWQLFQNRAAAAGIEAGTALLPVVLDLLNGVQNLAGDGLPLLVDGFDRVRPLMSAVAGITGDVVGLLADMAQIAAPVAMGMLGIVAAPVIGGLTVLAQALEAITGFLADNQTAALVLAGVIGGAYLVSMLQAAAATVAFNLQMFRAVGGMAAFTGGAGTMAAAARFAAVGVGGLAASLLSLQAVATAGFAAVFVVGALAINSWQKAGAAADQFVQKTTAGFDALQPEKAQRTIAALRETAERSVEYGKQFEGVGGNFRAGWKAIFGEADDIARRGHAAAETMLELQTQVANAEANLTVLASTTGLARTELVKLATANDIDLTRPVRQSAEEINQVISLTKDLERQTGVSTTQMAKAVGQDVEAMQALADSIQKVGEQTSKSFLGATDIIAAFDPGKAAGDLAEATDRQAGAQRDLNELVARQAGDKKRSISDDQALAEARRKVADATSDVASAQGDVTAAGLRETYQAQIDEAETFVANLETVTRKGLDPQLVARLLEQGPEAAAPVLQALVQDHSGRLIEMANESEAALREINVRVVEFSRLTTLATSAQTDDMVNDLGAAMRIASEKLAQGGQATATSIAKSLHIPRARVKQIAEEFGISLQAELRDQDLVIEIRPVLRGNIGPGKFGQLPVDGRKAGGRISGPGTGTSDSILIAASHGEHMMTAREVTAAGGHSAVEAWRRSLLASPGLPRYATGGAIGRAAAAPVTVVRVPVTETRTNTERWNVTLHGDSWSDLERQLRDRADLNSSPGSMFGGR